MNDALDAVQLLHRLIVSTCAVLLVFAISADHGPNRYDLAKPQFAAALAQWQALDLLADRDVQAAYVEAGLPAIVETAVPGTNAASIRFGPLPSPASGVPIGQARIPIQGILLFADRGKVDIYDIDSGKFRDALVRFAASHPDVGGVSDIHFIIGEHVAGSGLFDSPALSQPLFVGERPTNRLATLKLRARCLNGDAPESSSWFDLPDEIPFARAARPATHALAQLRSEGLVEYIKDKRVSLRYIWPVYEEIAHAEMVAVVPLLSVRAETLRAAHDKGVEVLGLTVDAKLAVLAGPMILVALGLTMLVDLRQVERLRARNAQRVADSAWMGTLENLIGRALTYGALCVLPPLSVALVVARLTASSLQLWGLLVLYACLFLPLVWAISLTLRRLARWQQCGLVP